MPPPDDTLGRQNPPLNAPAGGGGPGRFRIPQPLDASSTNFRGQIDSMRVTRTIIEVEVSTVAPWTGPLMVGAELYYRKNLDALQEAVDLAIRLAPDAIVAETGQAIKEIVGSILDALIMSAVIVGGSTALGGTIGGVIGFFFGGVGALPGAAAGAEVGFDIGMFLLEWLGLAFLIEHVASKLGEMASVIGPNVKMAWEAGDQTPPQRGIQIKTAARGIAHGIGKLFHIILGAIVMLLLAKGAAKVSELAGKLKTSRLGEAFGAWIERNWQKLVEDPRFNPRLRPKAKSQVGGAGGTPKGDTTAEAPPQKPQPPAAEPKPVATKSPIEQTADQIANGHAFDKHVTQQGEFPGVANRQQFAAAICQAMENAKGGDVRQLSGGRTAYWDNNNGMVVIHNPAAADGGTAFKPKNGKTYFDNLQ
jgi:hypothetical protein